LLFTLAWGLMALCGRPIGDYGVETDFYGDFVPTAHRWMHDGAQVGNGFRGHAGEGERAIAVIREGLKQRPGDGELRGLLEQLESGEKRVALGPR